MKMSTHTLLLLALLGVTLGCGDDNPTGGDGPINEDTFAITIRGDGSESVYAMTQSTSGGVVMVGEIDSNLSDGHVIHVGTDGTTLWNLAIGGNDVDRLFDVITANNGDIVAVGSSARDFWVVRISPAGNLIWQQTFDVSALDEGAGIAEAENGDFLIAGTILVELTAFDKQLIRISSSGELVWSRTYDHAVLDAAYAVVAADDGEFIVAGQSSTPQGGTARTQVFKVDAEGNEVWNNQYGSGTEYTARNLTLLPDGRIVVVGRAHQGGGTGSDPYILVLSSTGEQIDEFIIGRALYNDAGGVAVAANGNLVLVGTTTNATTQDRDIYLFEVSLLGAVQWEHVFGDAFSDRGSDVVISDDRIFACGSSEQDDDCCSDAFLIKTDLTGEL